MAENIEITVPIICENPRCSNCGNLVNAISELTDKEIDLFYESYDGSDGMDYCPICQELGVAEDYFVLDGFKSKVAL